MDFCGPEGDRQSFKQLPDQSMFADVWTKLVNPLRIENKPEWAKEKPKLDNAPKLRGIYFVDPEDREYSEDILKNTSWKDLWHQPCHAKDPSIVKTSTKPKIGQETEINHNV